MRSYPRSIARGWTVSVEGKMNRAVLTLLMAIVAASACAQSNMKGPEEWHNKHTRHAPQKTTAYTKTMASWGLDLYQSILRRYIASDCPMTPSCSAYSRQAVEKHGAILGTLLTADRLIHEKTEGPRVKKIWIRQRGWCSLDPVERHTAWWKRND